MINYLYFTNQLAHSLWAIATASGLLGVAVGGYLAAHNQKRERQRRRVSIQLAQFYGPMIALRAEILVKNEVRLKIGGAPDVAWRGMMEHAYKVDIEYVEKINEGRFPLFERIIDYDNRQLAEDIVPAYRKMAELFTCKMHLAESSTIRYFATFVEFVEIWNRWLDNSLPSEVLRELGHSGKKALPVLRGFGRYFWVHAAEVAGKTPLVESSFRREGPASE
jgi:hypothetical protein